MRTFIKTALAASVALAVSFPAFSAQKTMNCDVVVVGTGSAGMSAAVAAAEKGAKVIALEKNAQPGGATNFAEGLFAVESEWNRLRSDPLTWEKAFEGLQERHAHRLNAPLVRDFVQRSGEHIAWCADKGIKFRVVRMTPWEESTWHEITDFQGAMHGFGFIKGLKAAADKLGVQTLLKTPAVKLIKKDGRIVGVMAKSDKDDITINAKAVILATGGIGDDPKKVANWAHRDPEGWKPSCPIGKNGDGVQMAIDQGADLGKIGFCGHLGAEGKGIPFPGHLYTTSWQPSALWVNSDGDRFDNEEVAFSFSQAANTVYQQYGHKAWSIFDETQVEFMINRGVDSGIGVLVPVGKKLDKLRDEMKGALAANSDGFKAASSVAELAKKIGVPAANLEKAVADYNKGCEMGYDKDFGKKGKYMRKLDTKKLYAIKLRGNFFTAIGGLRTTRNFEVLDKANKPMPGLYAAGCDVSGFVGDTYTTWSSGLAFGFSSCSGRYAAYAAVKSIKGKM